MVTILCRWNLSPTQLFLFEGGQAAVLLKNSWTTDGLSILIAMMATQGPLDCHCHSQSRGPWTQNRTSIFDFSPLEFLPRGPTLSSPEPYLNLSYINRRVALKITNFSIPPTRANPHLPRAHSHLRLYSELPILPGSNPRHKHTARERFVGTEAVCRSSSSSWVK